jgi:glycosyltransferase involved in cell wall biosynthesis
VLGIFCREHARALATRHDVVVLASRATPRPAFRVYELADEAEEGIRTLRVRYRRPRLRPLAMVCQVIGMLAARRRLRRDGFRPDVVHAHVFSAGPPALVLARLWRAAYVITEHYTGFQRGLVTGADLLTAKVAFRFADLVAPVSHELAGHLRRISPTARIEVHPNTVDTDVFTVAAHERHDPPRRLVTVGTLTDKKGHAYLVEALAGVEAVHLDVVGEGNLRKSLETRAAELGVDVTFHGELPKHEVARLMRDSDLFVLPSTHETFGCVLIEAMASGLPSVATSVGGVPEVLGEEAGELVEARDPDALAGAIERVLERDFDREAMARETRERYGYDAFAEEWSGVYERLIESRRGRISSATTRRSDSSP